ncbi:unnamed protein product [Effrenium voratum]|uniref:Uncharacterized protein n=1 Tax=Effrenium voratum TaxID=2562239 RepID=A0AA36MHI2_9DINO|nr:unnamed protein product [Effrenium voratum]
MLDPCLSDTAWESQVLSRFAVMQKLKAEANVSSQHGACCPLPMEQLLTKGKLVEVAKEEELPRNPLMMYQAATRSCNNQTQQQQQFVAVFRRCGEAGYCCEARDLQWRLHPLNEDLAEDSLVQLVKMTENLQVEAEWIYRRLLRKMEEWKWVPREQKTMFYKMYIIYYHQVRMAMDRQKYCLFSPEDLDACEDPISLYVSVKKVRNEIHQTYRALRELGSCLQTGTKTLGAVKGKWPGKAIGVLGLLLRRAVHVLGTGQIQVRVHQLAGSLLRTAWQNRFEIILASLVVGAGQPLMMALTATGVSTGAATSWTLILEQFMRNFFVHVGCPILSSPMLMAMLVRWSMNKILLTDFFIDNVVGPLWEMAKKTLGPLAVLPQTLGVSLDVVKAVLRAVKGALGGNSTQDTRESWLEAARAFHATAAADLLYGFFSVTFGVMWRAVATAACTAARLALPVINGAEAGIDAGLQSFAKTWEGLARRASQGLKRGLQDETAKRVAQMAAEDRQVAEASRGIPSKTLALVHKMLGKGSVALASGADKSLSVFEKLLDMIGQSTIFVYGISSALSFLVLRVWQPSQEVVTDELLLASLGERLEDFNAYSCQGRQAGLRDLALFFGSQEGRDCALLRFGGLSRAPRNF